MALATQQFASVDDYISSFPADIQAILEEVRRTIRRVVPSAQETVTYQMPTITLDGVPLLYFAGWKDHISIYPVPKGDAAFEQELAPYRSGKSTVKFPLSKPIPYDLIERLLRLDLEQRQAAIS